jgi:hypothetical protein
MVGGRESDPGSGRPEGFLHDPPAGEAAVGTVAPSLSTCVLAVPNNAGKASDPGGQGQRRSPYQVYAGRMDGRPVVGASERRGVRATWSR